MASLSWDAAWDLLVSCFYCFGQICTTANISVQGPLHIKLTLYNNVKKSSKAFRGLGEVFLGCIKNKLCSTLCVKLRKILLIIKACKHMGESWWFIFVVGTYLSLKCAVTKPGKSSGSITLRCGSLARIVYQKIWASIQGCIMLTDLQQVVEMNNVH